MDTKTSTLSTNTNSPVAVGPVNSNYRMDRGRSTNWIFWASICGGGAALAFIYQLYQLLILVRQDNSVANSFLTISVFVNIVVTQFNIKRLKPQWH